MVLLSKVNEAAIVENLKKRYMDDQIFVIQFFYCASNMILKYSGLSKIVVFFRYFVAFLC